MKRFSRNGISLCKTCPLRDRPRVFGEYPTDGKPQMLLIGESPGSEESEQKRPFVGPAGGFLNHVLYEAEINRHRLWITNLVSCKPPENDLTSFEGEEALRCCAPGFRAELAAAKKAGVRIVVPLGTKPTNALGISEGITRARGSVYEKNGSIILPTFHPSFILRGARKEESTWIGDFIKARDISKNGWKPPAEKFDLFPSLTSLGAFTEAALKSKSPVAVDLETTGLSPDSGRIVVIGLGLPDRVIVVPMLKKTGLAYWAPSEYNAVLDFLRSIFLRKELVFQNAPFDISWLMRNGFSIGKVPHDVLLAHHTIHPELPHNLGYIVSVYGTTPFWKGEMLDREEKILAVEDETLRRYNARDVAVLHEVLPPLLADLDEFKLRHIYENIARKMVLPVVEMNLTGLLVDKKALEKWKRSLGVRKANLDFKMRELCNLHKDFSFSSDEDLRLLIYGIKAPKFLRAEEKITEYENNAKLRRDTKKYHALESLASVYESTHPLYAPKSTTRSTDSGKASVSAEALLARKIACNNRLNAIKGLKQKDASAERRDIERALNFFTLLNEFNEVDKLHSTYTKFPLWKDGKVHTSFLIHGTKTGRLASKNPNMQNVPPAARVMFKSRSGYSLVGRDFENLEVIIIAYASKDEALLKTIAAGKNVHDQNTYDLFEITKDHKMWKPARSAAKKFMFGRQSYGGSLYGIYEKIVVECPELNLTFTQLKKIDSKFQRLHEGLAAWNERQRSLGLTERRVENAFGRVRILLGDDSEIEREALNTPIQGSGADIVNKAMIAIWEEVRKKELDAKFCLQIHDELIMEVRDSQVKKTDAIMKKHMELPVELWGETVSISTKGAVAKVWANLK